MSAPPRRSLLVVGLVAGLVVGALADTLGFSPLFAVLAVFDLLGALVIWTVLQNKPASETAAAVGGPATQH